MKFNCIKCGRYICKLDMRRIENKEEYVLNCKNCLEERLDYARKLFG